MGKTVVGAHAVVETGCPLATLEKEYRQGFIGNRCAYESVLSPNSCKLQDGPLFNPVAQIFVARGTYYNGGMPFSKSSPLNSSNPHDFATTQWSIVLAAGKIDDRDAQAALSKLCESYWYPLYAYVRRRVQNVADAQDLTQAFFVHLLEQGAVARADRTRGRFRAFLLTTIKNFLANEWQKQHAEKRGGQRLQLSLDFDTGESRFQLEPTHDLTPEKLFERKWVTTLLDRVLWRVQAELEDAGKQEHFEHLKAGLVGDSEAVDYEQAAAALQITPAAAKQAAYRMRKRYRQIFRDEVARTVADESEVDEEIGRLLATLAE
ncbi:MAG: sigma-70 family RNA polymerase sigma factor [Planctomycetales bacterium]|nr:sigma-70 family RNA polymerase sigma factor [Planctomycetales bacterium]